MSGSNLNVQDALWEARVVHQTAPLRRSSSVHVRSASSASGTGTEQAAQAQLPLLSTQRSVEPLKHRRSVSAERALRPAAPARTRERFVPLPLPQHDEGSHGEEEEDARDAELQPLLYGGMGEPFSPTIPHTAGAKGRITVLTVCESFAREQAFASLQKALPHFRVRQFPEVLHVEAWLDPALSGVTTSTDTPQPADVFVFDYGVVVFWGMSHQQEKDVMRTLAPHEVKPLTTQHQHKDEMRFHYSADQPPHIQNDCITISRREACDHNVKMAISHALAQSSKLDLYEARVAALVEQVRHLPESLAVHGEVRLSRQQMAKIKGQVFILKSEVNTLGPVLDTPDFFWEATDALRALYDKVCEYCALDDRIELVNSRIMLIQSMLRIWSDHKAHHHLARLDNIIIILIIIEVVIAAAEVLGYFRVG